MLNCLFENGNVYDKFAVKTCDESGRMVGHLPRELSRITKFIIDCGAKVTAQLLGTHYRRSPLINPISTGGGFHHAGEFIAITFDWLKICV